MKDFHEIASSLGGDQDTASRIAALLAEADANFEPEKSLREAALLLLINKAGPSFGVFEALREIHRAFKQGCGVRHRHFAFTPEIKLALPPDLPPCPPPDPRYENLKDICMPEELRNMSDETLPAGAILPVIRCLSLSFYDYSGDPDWLPEALLARYGARAYPCILGVLADPDHYSFYPNNVRQLCLELLRVAGKLPQLQALQVFRTVFKSGWNKRFGYYINSLVPNGPVKAALVREFFDGPYGRLNLWEGQWVDFEGDALNLSPGGDKILARMAEFLANYPSWVKLTLIGYDPSNELIARGQTKVVSERLVGEYKVDPGRIQARWQVLKDTKPSVLVGIWPDEETAP